MQFIQWEVIDVCEMLWRQRKPALYSRHGEVTSVLTCGERWACIRFSNRNSNLFSTWWWKVAHHGQCLWWQLQLLVKLLSLLFWRALRCSGILNPCEISCVSLDDPAACLHWEPFLQYARVKYVNSIMLAWDKSVINAFRHCNYIHSKPSLSPH